MTIRKVNEKMIDPSLVQKVNDHTTKLAETTALLAETSNYVDTTKILSKMTQVHDKIKNGSILQYIIVGDSTREFGTVFSGLEAVLKPLGITCIRQAKSGLRAEHWSEFTPNLQVGYPTVTELIALISGSGSNTIVDISLGINDVLNYKTNIDIKNYFTKAITDIKAVKPNVTFMFTSPHLTTTNGVNYAEYLKLAYRDITKNDAYAYINVGENVFKTAAEIVGFQDDTVHLNTLGYNKVYRYILDVLIPQELKINYASSDYITQGYINPTDPYYDVLKDAGVRVSIKFIGAAPVGEVVLRKVNFSPNYYWYLYVKGEPTALSGIISVQNGTQKLTKPNYALYDFEAYITVKNADVLNAFVNYDKDISLSNYRVNALDTKPIKYHIPVDATEIEIQQLKGGLDTFYADNAEIFGAGIKMELQQTGGTVLPNLHLKKEYNIWYLFSTANPTQAVGRLTMKNGFQTITNDGYVSGLTYNSLVYINDFTVLNAIADNSKIYKLRNVFVPAISGKKPLKDLLYKLI